MADLFRMGATYRAQGPRVTVTGRLVLVQRDSGGGATGIWLEEVVAEKLAKTLFMLGPDVTVTELAPPEQDTGSMPKGYPVRQATEGMTAEQIVSQATAERGEGPVGGVVPGGIRDDEPEG
jgi:hypothetical protein